MGWLLTIPQIFWQEIAVAPLMLLGAWLMMVALLVLRVD